MAAKFRNVIAANSLNTLRTLKCGVEREDVRKLAGQIRLDYRQQRISLNLPTRCIPHFSPSLLSSFIRTYPEDAQITGVAADDSHLKFHVDSREFVEQVLRTTISRPKGYKWSRNALFDEQTKHIVLEFSSPNIAKPFHIGHFRSTVIGNFVANINQAVGHRVTKLNYLGDWGTQFGYLMAGIEQFDVDIQDIKEEPLKKLLDIYIKANQLGESEPQFQDKARDMFRRLEEGDPQLLEVWQYFRTVSIQELKAIYRRLNINFDEYHGESMYSREKAGHILNMLIQHNLLEDSEGRKIVRLSDGKTVTIVKSDGSSLYITRDIAAAIHRHDEYRFDRLIYVVDSAQSSHFSNLFSILQLLGCSWATSCSHVRFGKIKGISTRKGNIVFLDTLIDEARTRMLENQHDRTTTRVAGEEAESAASVLGISALIVSDFKQKRARDYSFSWEQALNPSGNTGVRLQYLHARLSSLEENSGVELMKDCCTAPLVEKDAVELAAHIGFWDETLYSSYTELEPCIIVQYLFTLAQLTNRCLKSLNVKGAEETTARARLLLFLSAKQVLGEGLEIIGISPLDRM